MADKSSITATLRSETGKGAAHRLRRKGLVPAVLYGRGKESQSLTFKYSDLKDLIFSAQGGLSLTTLHIEGKTEGEQETVVAVKEYQIDPVRRDLLHADLHEVDLNKPMQVEVPINLVGTAIGLDEGGMLQQIRRTLLLSALPREIPAMIDVDISHLETGQSIHVGEVQTGDGVEMITDPSFTIATVVIPRGLEEEVAVEEEGAEDLEGEEAVEEEASDQEE
jgi:large subunit ribosomal protein L25